MVYQLQYYAFGVAASDQTHDIRLINMDSNEYQHCTFSGKYHKRSFLNYYLVAG